METLVNYILCRSTRCSAVLNTYILSISPGWLGGMRVLFGDFIIRMNIPIIFFIYTTSCDKKTFTEREMIKANLNWN